MDTKTKALEQRFLDLVDLPTESWEDEDLEFVTQMNLERRVQKGTLSRRFAPELHWLRLSGLSALQFIKKPFKVATDEDFIWWESEISKEGLYDPKKDKQIIGTLGPRASGEYFMGCLKEEKLEKEAYLKDNWEFLSKNFPIYIASWLNAWGQFLIADDLDPDMIDWSIFFSLLDPRPPHNPYVKFPQIIRRVLTTHREIQKPLLIKKVWEDKDLRETVLRGGPLPYQWEVICPYSTIYSNIQDLQELEDKRKEAGRDMERGRNHRMKELLPLFRQMVQAQEEGKETSFTTSK